MRKEIKLPEIAENIETAIVLDVLVSEGDKISEDDTIAEMESDKATFDLPSEVSGTVKEIKIKENDEVKVGQVVIVVETEEEKEEETEEKAGKEDAEKEEEETKKKEGKEVEKEKMEEEEEEEAEEVEEEKIEKGKKEEEEKVEEEEQKEKETDKERKTREETKEETQAKREKEVPASPSVRRLAREIGVDIYQVEGTGPENRITTDDVKSFAKEAVSKTGKKTASLESTLPDFSKWGDIERQPMDSIRKRTSSRMVDSWQSIPHVFQFDKADVTHLEEFRKKYGKQVEKEGAKLTVTAILLKITAVAMNTFPKFNASLDFANEEVIYKKYVHIGVAVDTERGLLVPVIRNADKKSIVELSVELNELAEKARNKKIKPDELQGGNFAISNLGGIGGTNFTPIIYKPNVAILGVSRTRPEPVWMENEFKPRLMLPLSLSYDHRIIDGAEGARFLRWMCEALENPLLTMFKGEY